MVRARCCQQRSVDSGSMGLSTAGPLGRQDGWVVFLWHTWALQWHCPGHGLAGCGAGWQDRDAPNYCSITACLSKKCLVGGGGMFSPTLEFHVSAPRCFSTCRKEREFAHAEKDTYTDESVTGKDRVRTASSSMASSS